MNKRLLGGLLALLALPVVSGEFVVRDAYIRGLPPGQTVTAAFMTLDNGLDKDCQLVGASSPLAGSAEVHAHSHHGGTMSMRPVPSLLIPSGEQVSLSPGGYHLMLFGIQNTLEDDNEYSIRLLFKGCPEVEIKAPVRSVLSEGGNR
ncbi:MAG: copper chaperone PCu(A)C [Gammaproteobacteria bacterium]|nr:MAG: copper chaperone PCu(A)C [Gammaproteobacteria bacterium]